MKTRKELEIKVDRLLEGGQKLSKDIIELGQRIANISKILQEVIGVMDVLKRKGVLTDEEITTAIADARKKYLEQKRIQSELAGSIADGRGHVGFKLLRETGADSDRRGKGDKIK